MSLEQQLERWKKAELISPEQAERLRAFERQRARPTLPHAIAGLAGLAIAIGIVSIVAANWEVIPGRIKLALDAVALIGVGQALVQLGNREPGWIEEAVRVAYYGLVLASIALVAQVYQLGGSTARALLVWSGLTFPLMALGRSPKVAVLWLIGLEVTYFVGLAELAEAVPRYADQALAAAYWAPIIGLALGRSAWLARLRPSYARVLRGAAWAQLVLLASAASFAFYEALGRGERSPWLVVFASLSAAGWLCWTTEPSPSARAERLLLAVTFAAIHLPLFMPHGRWPVLGALAFMVVFGAVAFAAHRRGRPALLHLGTAAIGLRLLIVYFEVFGSLLDTGLGLLLGGVLTLCLSWLWARKRRGFDREISARESAP